MPVQFWIARAIESGIAAGAAPSWEAAGVFVVDTKAQLGKAVLGMLASPCHAERWVAIVQPKTYVLECLRDMGTPVELVIADAPGALVVVIDQDNHVAVRCHARPQTCACVPN